MEEVGDRIVNGDKALNMRGRLEPFHLPFSSSRCLIGVLGPDFEPFVLAVFAPDMISRFAVLQDCSIVPGPRLR
jgi:hypothetical protein